MNIALEIAYCALGIIILLSFSGALAAAFLLVPYYDDGKERSWFIRWQYSANPTLPLDLYRKEGWRYWRMRDRCLKVFAICAGLTAILAVIAAVAGIELPPEMKTK